MPTKARPYLSPALSISPPAGIPCATLNSVMLLGEKPPVVMPHQRARSQTSSSMPSFKPPKNSRSQFALAPKLLMLRMSSKSTMMMMNGQSLLIIPMSLIHTVLPILSFLFCNLSAKTIFLEFMMHEVPVRLLVYTFFPMLLFSFPLAECRFRHARFNSGSSCLYIRVTAFPLF